jgi:hypothetical protein
MLVTLSALASYQSKATEQTAEDAEKILNDCATHPDAILRYEKSDMILTIHSDVSYLSESKARSRAGGFFYMGRDAKHKGAILATSSIMKLVISSNWGIIRKLQENSCTMNNTGRNGLATARHAKADRQFDRMWHRKRYNQATKITSHRYSILLGSRSH